MYPLLQFEPQTNIDITFIHIYSKKSLTPPKGPLGPPPPPPDAGRKMIKSKSYSPQRKATKTKVPPPVFDLESVNKKIAKPEDYNEIQFKALDPMAVRLQQKMQGTHATICNNSCHIFVLSGFGFKSHVQGCNLICYY